MIQVENLQKTYTLGQNEVHALRGVTFQVAAGEFVALTGPSGSGKSTLMHLLGCLDRPSDGRYLLQDRDVSRLSADEQAEVRNQHIGFVFQKFNLLPRITALENVMLPLLYRGRVKDASQQATTALRTVGLADRAHHRPAEMSGGQQQRVAIARALVTDPAIILADEPTGNLDSRTGAEVLDLLLNLAANGRTILVVTHDPSVAGRAGRVLQMMDGVMQ
ncbi:MAG: ABC transporter ATP-binding protein [Chloroflexi bacterium]|nr:ABC transporter ATP-binding protein [Chloroflexota bacterium]MBK7179982.1 ABC transporter ATP-binding protein [Chloroflexota bacterium]MBK7915407.1 ABC transporter ATP-binding protein [Chloroflexota bacterium]MBP6803213.1 ABC transporter ATP-binding protein [Chloroflexota bacterium]MBP7591898.1 ABC transporter ATP-binding protein [Chloroflexota bacterium]